MNYFRSKPFHLSPTLPQTHLNTFMLSYILCFASYYLYIQIFSRIHTHGLKIQSFYCYYYSYCNKMQSIRNQNDSYKIFVQKNHLKNVYQISHYLYIQIFRPIDSHGLEIQSYYCYYQCRTPNKDFIRTVLKNHLRSSLDFSH